MYPGLVKGFSTPPFHIFILSFSLVLLHQIRLEFGIYMQAKFLIFVRKPFVVAARDGIFFSETVNLCVMSSLGSFADALVVLVVHWFRRVRFLGNPSRFIFCGGVVSRVSSFPKDGLKIDHSKNLSIPKVGTLLEIAVVGRNWGTNVSTALMQLLPIINFRHYSLSCLTALLCQVCYSSRQRLSRMIAWRCLSQL